MRFIQIGVGGWGRIWVRLLRKNRNVRVVALIDVSKKALTAACEIGGYNESICFPTLRHALNNLDADAIVCVTPPEHHRQSVVQAMKAGLDALSEKPMATNLADCKAMLKTAQDTGRMCVISQNYRYQPATWTMADLIRCGRIGEVGQVKVDFYLGNDFHGGFRHEMDYPLLVDMSIHHFDLIRFITGLNAVAVQGKTWNPSWSNYKGDCSCSLVFEMENGARVVYSASWCAKGQFCNWNGDWQIEGNKGSIVYKNDSIILNKVPKLYTINKAKPILLKKLRKSGQEYVLNDFIKAVEKGRRPQTDVSDNIQSIAMVFAAVRAVKTGKRVSILDKDLRQIVKNTTRRK